MPAADVSLCMGPEEGGPVSRALLCIEAELFIEDADSLVTGHERLRTPEMRRADALVLLVTRSAKIKL